MGERWVKRKKKQIMNSKNKLTVSKRIKKFKFQHNETLKFKTDESNYLFLSLSNCFNVSISHDYVISLYII